MQNLAPIETTLKCHYGIKDLKLEAKPQSGSDIHKSFVLILIGRPKQTF